MIPEESNKHKEWQIKISSFEVGEEGEDDDGCEEFIDMLDHDLKGRTL